MYQIFIDTSLFNPVNETYAIKFKPNFVEPTNGHSFNNWFTELYFLLLGLVIADDKFCETCAYFVAAGVILLYFMLKMLI